MLENKGQDWTIILRNTFCKGRFVGRNLVHHGSLCKLPLIYYFFLLPCSTQICSFIHQRIHNICHVVYHFCSQVLVSLVEMK